MTKYLVTKGWLEREESASALELSKEGGIWSSASLLSTLEGAWQASRGSTHFPLHPSWLLKWGPLIGSISITWELVRTAQVPSLCSHTPSRWFFHLLKFEKHWYVRCKLFDSERWPDQWRKLSSWLYFVFIHLWPLINTLVLRHFNNLNNFLKGCFSL